MYYQVGPYTNYSGWKSVNVIFVPILMKIFSFPSDSLYSPVLLLSLYFSFWESWMVFQKLEWLSLHCERGNVHWWIGINSVSNKADALFLVLFFKMRWNLGNCSPLKQRICLEKWCTAGRTLDLNSDVMAGRTLNPNPDLTSLLQGFHHFLITDKKTMKVSSMSTFFS